MQKQIKNKEVSEKGQKVYKGNKEVFNKIKK